MALNIQKKGTSHSKVEGGECMRTPRITQVCHWALKHFQPKPQSSDLCIRIDMIDK